jgi:8-oxo-dGTP pyrophosphatase MutT (NUDIX family)
MIIHKWKVLSKEITLKANIFRYLKVQSQSPNTENVGNFDVIQCFNWVNVIALTKDKKIILVKQYRHGLEDVTLEIPGGAVHPEEDFLLAAQRELAEETGYTSKNWKKMGRVSANPAFMNNYCETYLAIDAECTTSQTLDEFEEINVELYPVSELRSMVNSEKIHHSLVIAALYFLTGVGGVVGEDP